MPSGDCTGPRRVGGDPRGLHGVSAWVLVFTTSQLCDCGCVTYPLGAYLEDGVTTYHFQSREGEPEALGTAPVRGATSRVT